MDTAKPKPKPRYASKAHQRAVMAHVRVHEHFTEFLAEASEDRDHARDGLERFEVPLRAGPESFAAFLAGEGLTEGEFYPLPEDAPGPRDPPWAMDLGEIAKRIPQCDPKTQRNATMRGRYASGPDYTGKPGKRHI